jgi:glycosyltransferase involved in cell wall biosynthesis
VNVGLDLSPLALTRAGTARYLEGLLPHLRARVALTGLRWGGGGRLTAAVRDAWWYPVALPLRARGLDVLHCPTFRAPLRSSVPLVVTVHDLAVLRHPDAFRRWSRAYRRVVPHAIRAATRLIAVSEFTKRELVELTGVPEERVRVVPNAVGPPFAPEGPRAEGEYVLAVGTLEPRKNLERLTAAMDGLGVELRVVGARGWGGVDVAGVTWLGAVDDDELARLYRGALAVAYPSLYEGFGIPVLEAMASGAAVVTSAGTAMAEVADGAAVLVDPTDVGSIRAGIERAIAERDELGSRGPARAAGYTWEAAAEATVRVYEEAAGA